MVTISNGVQSFDVPSGSVGNFASAGFKPVNGKSKNKENKQAEQEQENFIEKPVSKWTNNEVKQFAAENGIDISDTKNAKEAKDIIEKFLNGEA